ncbi:MAG: toxin [Lentisphaerae bacterium RIFOXYC12_FULL_60_16]|nr:MAG: toxin [Lentisphaerae bacterium RIFOXYC12_FULL_60_16]OGV70295.1 MAG: toxin [Lentisphaerae bacterium RIFOXYA12_FULL_60_10]OGV84123.1 MAG: toxin [Lentisphaerae bacterium RIFOXYB12_FULL_60_10]
MKFEFDYRKSQANRVKHGIDFVNAQALWSDPDFVEIPARTEDEPRFMVIGRIEQRIWAGVITYRGETVRIISVRPAGEKEVEIYEG